MTHMEFRTRPEYETEPPEDWRFCHTQGTWALFTNAPTHANPHEYETVWVKIRYIRQHREVSDWVDS